MTRKCSDEHKWCQVQAIDFYSGLELSGKQNKVFVFIAKSIHYVQYSNHNYSMSFSRRYNTGIPQLKERMHEFLRTKDLTGQVENEFHTGNAPTGWAILTVDTSDPKLLNELDGFISNLERIAMRESTILVCSEPSVVSEEH
jgi:hypothetical protein